MTLVRWLTVFLCFYSLSAYPGDISVLLDQVRLPDLARVVLGHINQKPFIFSPEFDKDETRASLSLKSIEGRAALTALDGLLLNSGFLREDRSGVSWVIPAKLDKLESVELFRPRYRSPSYIVEALTPFFKPGSFGGGSRSAISASFSQSQGGLLGQAGQTNQSNRQLEPSTVTHLMPFSSQSSPALDVVMFRGADDERRRFLKLAGDLDRSPGQMVVKAVVYEVTTSKSDGSAIGIVAKLFGNRLGINIGKSVTAGDWSGILNVGGISVVIDLLANDSRFKTLSAPNLRVESDQTAKLVVGTQTPVLGAATLDKNGNPVQSVEYRPSGVIFSLTPKIFESGAQISVSQEVSSFAKTTTGVNGSPTLTQRAINTTLMIANDDVIVIGGLESGSVSGNDAGPSWLPGFLHSTYKEAVNSEIVLILQATRI